VVWVPQHEALEPLVDVVPGVRHTGAFSRYDEQAADQVTRRRAGAGRAVVVVMLGAGGSTFPVDAWRTQQPPSGVEVLVLGGGSSWSSGAVRSMGHVEDPAPFLLAADVVVSAAGWASVHDLASLGVPAALVAEPRPFDEQAVRLAALTDAGLVLGRERWPTPAELGAVIDAATELAPARWDRFYDRKGARHAAEMIEQVHRGAA
jgi:predicted glycosyltransferase